MLVLNPHPRPHPRLLRDPPSHPHLILTLQLSLSLSFTLNSSRRNDEAEAWLEGQELEHLVAIAHKLDQDTVHDPTSADLALQAR